MQKYAPQKSGTAVLLILSFVLWDGCSCNSEITTNEYDGGHATDGICDPAAVCGSSCCVTGEICYQQTCLTPVGTCEPQQPCQEDSVCIDGRCLPWGQLPTMPFDEDCTRTVEPGRLRPQLQCAWEGEDADAFAVRHTPLVVDFGIGNIDRPMGPSVVIISKGTYSEEEPRGCQSSGIVIILDGRTCKESFTLDDPLDRVLATVTPAIADLNGDGTPEIIAAAPEGGLLAFRFDRDQNKFVRHWRSTEPDGTISLLGSEACLWGGITVADLDGDTPEILFHGAAHDSNGRIIARIDGYTPIPHDNPMVVADVNLDGNPEVLEGNGTFKFSTTGGFSLIEGWIGMGLAGFIAVADFGDFPAAATNVTGQPEIVVVHKGLRIQTALGEVVFLPSGDFHEGMGGPPTVADFDGDGEAEVGVAFGNAYTVYDPGCTATTAGCAGPGVLWTQPSQDVSSARTGSSVFDFNGDGRAEVVYGDECFVRVYDGPTGNVIFSQGRFSSTWQENAIVADVDGDAAAEIVLPASYHCNPGYCPTLDPSFAGLLCDTADDCPGGPCTEGFCRCTSAQECGESFTCAEPLPATPGTGNVCRTQHTNCSAGIRIYRDARDRWAGSRKIWNQHAYNVTNVEEDGTIPSKDQIKNNWQEAGLNNFRQNVQGHVGDLASPDLTIREVTVKCNEGSMTLGATVCNRGTTGNDAGVSVIIIDTSNNDVLCTTSTQQFLDVAQCEEVSCDAATGAAEVMAVVNTNSTVGECNSDNNQTAPTAAQCP